MGGAREEPATTALIYGVATNIATVAVFAAAVVDASRAVVLGLLGLVAISGYLAYRATRRYLHAVSANTKTSAHPTATET
ncbi:MAG: hypothetical protein INR66_03560 [Gordonia polyisoprenivorans]|nr:hypothetical protein [Gordonia polyisoprenivorans]